MILGNEVDHHNTHDTRSRNRRQKSTPFSGAGFRRRFFVPYASGLKISGAEKNRAESELRRIIIIICN